MVRPSAKVTIESLKEVVYKKSIGTKINDLTLCLEVVSRSCQPLRDVRRWISLKPLQIEAWFQLHWIEQCFTSPPTQYRLYGRRFLQVKKIQPTVSKYWRRKLQRKTTQKT